jgi:apolipoprotein D and lipocalin family protein
MKTIAIILMLAAVALLLGACHNNYQPMDTVKEVDLTRYTGKWYEIARYPHRFEKGCSSVTAEYSLQDDGTIQVVNRCILREQGGKEKRAEGKAKVVDTASNAKLKVSFFWPFYGDYWIVKLDDNYQYAIIGEPSRKYVWILARTPEIDRDLYDQLVSEIKRIGYDSEKLIRTEHGKEKP